jgi:hypothetical protein
LCDFFPHCHFLFSSLGESRMLTIRSPVVVSLLLVLSAFTGVEAAPKRKGGASLTPQQQLAQIPQGVSTATDGSAILDSNVTVK